MEIKFLNFTISFFFSITVFAQTYQVDNFSFVDNEEAKQYYAQIDSSIKHFSTSMKDILSNK